MAKIRGIKPEFWTDEEIVELSLPARLLFIGMWNFACDNGHLADKPKQIKMRILPADDVNVAELLRELTACNRVTRENGVITVVGLTRHQRVDKRYFTTCDAPGCTAPEPDSQHGPRRAPAVPTKSTRRAPKGRTPRPRVDGDGDGDGDSLPSPSQTHAETPTSKAQQPPDGGERDKPTGHTPARQLAATLLGIDQDNPRLDNLPAVLASHNVRTPAAWLRTAAANGDLAALLDSAPADSDPWAHLPVLNPKPAGWTDDPAPERTLR